MSCLWQNFFNRIIFYWELTCKLDDRMHYSCVVLTLPFAQTLIFFLCKMMLEFWTKKRYCKQREILYLLVIIFINKHNISSSVLVGVDPSFVILVHDAQLCPHLSFVPCLWSYDHFLSYFKALFGGLLWLFQSLLLYFCWRYLGGLFKDP